MNATVWKNTGYCRKKHHPRSEIILHTSTSHGCTRFLAIAHESDTSCFHPKPSPKLPPIAPYIAPPANGCGRLTTVANAETTSRKQGSYISPKREPFPMHSDNKFQKNISAEVPCWGSRLATSLPLASAKKAAEGFARRYPPAATATTIAIPCQDC